MKILLISSNVANTPYAVYPLGMSMVASALVDAGHEVRQTDFLKIDRSTEYLTQALGDFKPDMVGISIRNIDNVNLMSEQRYVDAVLSIVKVVKETSQAVVILGGSGFSIMPDVFLDKTGADYGIVGEGEHLIVELVNNAAKGIFPKEKCLKGKPRLQGREIPSALYDDELMRFYLESGHVASVQTKRGCSYQCVYCTYPVLEGARLRHRDPIAVVDDIQTLAEKHHAKLIFFIDSVFNDRQGNYLKVIEEMKRRGVSVPWTAFFTPEGLTDDIVVLMKETGLKAAELGSDASTDTTLRGLKTTFGFKDIVETNDLFVKHGISVAHYFMFGCPGENKDSVMEGIENIKNLQGCVSFMFMGIRILPGTALYDIALDQGLLKADDDLLESTYYIDPQVNKDWMEEKLTEGFKGLRNCIFPPDALDASLQFLHKMGYSGSLWDMLLKGKERRKRNLSYESKL